MRDLSQVWWGRYRLAAKGRLSWQRHLRQTAGERAL